MGVDKVDKLSLAGFGQGKSEKYEAARPRYDPQILSCIRALIPKDSGINVVEIGSGTGLFTRALLNHPDWQTSLAALHAIEPNEGMRNVFHGTISDPRVTLTDGVFERTGVEDMWADMIVMAAAFHWCLDYEAAILEFSRILKPDGVVVIVSYDADEKDRLSYLQEIMSFTLTYDPRTKKESNPAHERWSEVFNAPSYTKLFEGPREDITKTSKTITVDHFVEFIMTFSFIAVLDEEERAKVAKRIREVMERGEGVDWVNKEKGVFTSPSKTVAVSMRKK